MAEPTSPTDDLRPTSNLVEDERLNELAKLVNEAFPNLSCLRCSNERFYLVESRSVVPHGSFQLPGDAFPRGHFHHVELICSRCGYVERHEVTVLKNATKPIISKG
ncbi:hypothetical protein DSM21852_10320 [Methylocystis bryophila]|nr:hypothetical protein DSM21852_10320 [Methylocystis bryophila]